jgi:hypothetical protein
MTDALTPKPCPFCNGEYHDRLDGHDPYHAVDHMPWCFFRKKTNNWNEYIEAWNKRFNEDKKMLCQCSLCNKIFPDFYSYTNHSEVCISKSKEHNENKHEPHDKAMLHDIMARLQDIGLSLAKLQLDIKRYEAHTCFSCGAPEADK